MAIRLKIAQAEPLLQDRDRKSAFSQRLPFKPRELCGNAIVMLFLFPASIPKGTLSHNALQCLCGKLGYSGRAEKAM